MGDNVKVLVRLRPLLPFEHDPAWLHTSNSLCTSTTLPRSNRNASSERKLPSEGKEVQYQFQFESVIGEATSSEQLYKREIRTQFLQCCRMRRNVSIMAYGQTCSGKTHTILGVSEAPGLIPCLLRDLFSLKQDRKYSLKASYNEIYNEKISDLLDPKDKAIKIAESTAGTGFELTGTSKESITTFEDALKMLEKGEKMRQYGQGEYHDRSSRSHTLLTIFIDEWDVNLQVHSYTISVVDLAGSQRLTHERQSSQEAGFINKSLFQLTNCIYKLSDKAPHIPFRDSKLTKLLEPSLSGSGRSFIICCVSPSKSCLSETLSTLRLAERAKKIELKEPIVVLSGESEVQRLKARLEKKNKQCSALKGQIDQLNQRIFALEGQLKKSKRSQSKRQKENLGNLLILLDHENFTLFLSGHISEEYSQSESFHQLKEAFVEKLQSLYESYTKDVLKNCFGDAFELQIEEICFMNMVLEHQRISSYKIEIVEELLKQQEEKGLEGGNWEMFYSALLQYQNKLKRDFQFNEQSVSYRSSYRDHSRENSDFSNYSNHFSIPPETFSTRAKKEIPQKLGTQILMWGCKKDSRVCKGEPGLPGMVRINNLGRIRGVVCGHHHTLVVTEEGHLYGWGKNTERQLLNCEKESISAPTQIKSIKNIKSAAAGWGHSLALTISGEVYAWGYGKDGQLGLGRRENQLSPVQIQTQQKVAAIFAGHSHSAFFDTLGNLYTFGFNQDYRLMIGDQKQVCSPKRVPIRDVISVGLGITHSAIVTSNGSVFAGGTGRNGQLGVELNEYVPGWEKLEAVDRKFEDQTYQKICPLIQVEGFGRNSKAKAVRCGENMTIVLSQSGQVLTFGKQLSNRLGHGRQGKHKILEKISAVQCGNKTGLALNEGDNKLYSWGFNMYGQANPQTTGDIPLPQLIQGLPQRKIISISSGFFHSVLLLQ